MPYCAAPVRAFTGEPGIKATGRAAGAAGEGRQDLLQGEGARGRARRCRRGVPAVAARRARALACPPRPSSWRKRRDRSPPCRGRSRWRPLRSRGPATPSRPAAKCRDPTQVLRNRFWHTFDPLFPVLLHRSGPAASPAFAIAFCSARRIGMASIVRKSARAPIGCA